MIDKSVSEHCPVPAYRWRSQVMAIIVVAAWAVAPAYGQSTRTGSFQPASWQPPAGTVTLPLWPGKPPGTGGATVGPEVNASNKWGQKVAGRQIDNILGNISKPTLTLFPAKKDKNTGVAVLVFPGGSYTALWMKKEGTEPCHWLNSIGVNCVLLKYRAPKSGPYPKYSAALDDAQRAMGLVREHARAWHINPDKIGVLGFSSGGNLVGQLSTHFNHRLYPAVDAADQLPCRPAFAMLLYPSNLTLPQHNFGLAPNIQVTSNTPTAFLVQAENDDETHVENSVEYFLALKAHEVPAELHVYAAGGHGFALRPTAFPITRWPKLASTWLHTIGMLPSDSR